MTSNPIDPKNKIGPKQLNELSEQELEKVAAGGIDEVKDFAKDVYEEGKELVSDTFDTIKKYL